MVQAYQTKCKKLAGTDFREVNKKAFAIYRKIKQKSKRRPYVRSIYFRKTKIFLSIFWQHTYDKKHYKDQVKRLKFFPCGIELIKFTKYHPESKENVDDRSGIFHRFSGITSENEIFFVQIKENKRTGEKFLISIFPLD